MSGQAKHWNFSRLVTYRETGWVEAESVEDAKNILSDPSFTLTNDGDVEEHDVADDISDVEVESVTEMEDDS